MTLTDLYNSWHYEITDENNELIIIMTTTVATMMTIFKTMIWLVFWSLPLCHSMKNSQLEYCVCYFWHAEVMAMAFKWIFSSSSKFYSLICMLFSSFRVFWCVGYIADVDAYDLWAVSENYMHAHCVRQCSSINYIMCDLVRMDATNGGTIKERKTHFIMGTVRNRLNRVGRHQPIYCAGARWQT